MEAIVWSIVAIATLTVNVALWQYCMNDLFGPIENELQKLKEKNEKLDWEQKDGDNKIKDTRR